MEHTTATESEIVHFNTYNQHDEDDHDVDVDTPIMISHLMINLIKYSSVRVWLVVDLSGLKSPEIRKKCQSSDPLLRAFRDGARIWC